MEEQAKMKLDIACGLLDCIVIVSMQVRDVKTMLLPAKIA